jgi:glycogen operon protein
VTSHDGFTLNDLVSYCEKQNLANGENNRDGDNNNFSENFGIEGPTDEPQVNQLRRRQIKNMLTTLMLSQGVPMLVAGDEFQRTQQGNNNAYCQDNEISWLDWNLVNENSELVRFCRSLIEFRRHQPTVRRHHFLTGVADREDCWPDVSWYNPQGTSIDWHTDALPILCLLAAPLEHRDSEILGRDVLLMFNSSHESAEFVIPEIAKSRRWHLFIDTAAESPEDIYPNLDGPVLESEQACPLPLKSLKVYVAGN